MPRLLRFDCYEVDLDAGQIRKGGIRLRLSDQPFRVLAALLEHPGEPVTRDELRRRLWRDEVFVDFEAALNTDVAKIREALGDSAAAPRFIETLPKRGYRFIARVSESAATEAPGVRKPRLLVLPFVNSSSDRAHESFCDAVTDEMIADVATLGSHSLAVIARTTTMRYKGSRKDIARIGQELAVDYVVEGAVRCTDNSVALNVQLVRVSDQAHVWARKYEASRDAAFFVERTAAREIEAALGPATSAATVTRHEVETKRTADPLAYREYAEGRRELETFRTLEEAAASIEHLRNAIARQPDFALAHEALALLYTFQGYCGLMAPRDAFAIGVLHAVRVMEIDSTRAEAYALLAQYRKQLDYDWPEVEREMARARELGPSSPVVGLLYSMALLIPEGRIEEAIAELERAAALDPLSLWIHTWLGVTFALARDPERATEEGRLLIELDADSPWGYWVLGFAMRAKGLTDESIAAHRKAARLSGDSPMMLGWLGLALGGAGRQDEAREVLERLQAMSRVTYVTPSSFAWLCLGLRQLDTAFEWLDRAVDARDQFMMPIKSYPFFDPLRADPRFVALLRKMKLEG